MDWVDCESSICSTSAVVLLSRPRHVRLMDVARLKPEFWKLRDFPFTLFCSRLSSADWSVCEWGEIGGGCQTRFRVWFL